MVHTGKGKGKSSAAIGMVFRAAGWGKRVLVVQFIKGQWSTGEERAAKAFENIEWHALGDGFTWDTKNLAQDQATTLKIWDFAKEKLFSGNYDLVLLDEINYCLDYGWLDPNEVARCCQKKPAETHLILTGRGAPEELIAVAHTVTEMKLVTHAYQQGFAAQKGIEF